MHRILAVLLCPIAVVSLPGCPGGSARTPFYVLQYVYDDSAGLSPYWAGSSLDESGTVVGKHSRSGCPAIWQHGMITELPQPPDAFFLTVVAAISDSGAVVASGSGYVAGDPGNMEYQVLMWKDGVDSVLYRSTTREFEDSGRPLPAYIWAVNDSLEAVGAAYINGSDSRPALFLQDQAVLLPTLTPDALGEAFAINQSGDIAGYCAKSSEPKAWEAILWTGGTMVPLGDLGGGSSQAYAINDRGQVVGESAVPEGQNGSVEAFEWSDGVMTKLPKGDADNTCALDINNDGVIVGLANRNDSQASWAVMWQPMPGGSYRLVNLQDCLLPLDPSERSPILTEAVDINDRGQILVHGYEFGGWNWVLLSPIGAAF